MPPQDQTPSFGPTPEVPPTPSLPPQPWQPTSPITSPLPPPEAQVATPQPQVFQPATVTPTRVIPEDVAAPAPSPASTTYSPAPSPTSQQFQPTTLRNVQPDSGMRTPEPAQPVTSPPAPMYASPVVATTNTTVLPTTSATSPEGVFIGGITPDEHAKHKGLTFTAPGSMPTGKKRLPHGSKLLLLSLLVLLVIGGGGVAAYFGYYMNPNVIWSQSLGHMNKGYSALSSYLNTQSAAQYKGVNETGSFKVQAGGTSYNGSLAIQSYGGETTVSSKLDLGIGNLDFEARTITPNGSSQPDVYLQLSGIKQFSSYLGPTLGPAVGNLDGQWIVVDHNLIADVENAELKRDLNQGTAPQLTWSEINSFLQAAGKVNQQYVFTANKKTAVTEIVKKYGMETINGHKTYHYKVGFVKANVKAYITAMCGALQQSDLGGYIRQATNNTEITTTCMQLEASTDKIDSSDTVDVWADVNTRMIYQVRINDTTNPAQNFVDVGLNYTGGSSYPFFVSGQVSQPSGAGTFSVTASLNSKTNVIAVGISATITGTSPLNFSGNLSFQPSTAKLNLTVPAGAIPITTVLSNLGLGAYVNAIQNLGTNAQTTAFPLAQSSRELLMQSVL